jgi:hypothetical protein
MSQEIKVAVMQPTYFPWCGYFELINKVDKFVFLDDVPLAMQRPNWQKENRILGPQGARWIRVPAIRTRGDVSFINDVIVDDSKHWRSKHLSLMLELYQKSDFFGLIYPSIASLLNEGNTNNLAEINIGLIVLLSEYLELDVEFYRSSELVGVSGVKQDRILSICGSVNGTSYYSPQGAMDYISSSVFEENNIKLTFQEYTHPEYNQFNNIGPFVSHLSVIDVISDYGKAARDIIVSGA